MSAESLTEITREDVQRDLREIRNISVEYGVGYSKRLDFGTIHVVYVGQEDDSNRRLIVDYAIIGRNADEPDEDEPDSEEDFESSDDDDSDLRFSDEEQAEIEKQFQNNRSRYYHPAKVLSDWRFVLRTSPDAPPRYATMDPSGVVTFNDLPEVWFVELSALTANSESANEVIHSNAEEQKVTRPPKDELSRQAAVWRSPVWTAALAASVLAVASLVGVLAWNSFVDNSPPAIQVAEIRRSDKLQTLGDDSIQSKVFYDVTITPPHSYWQAFTCESFGMELLAQGAPSGGNDPVDLETQLRTLQQGGYVYLVIVASADPCESLPTDFPQRITESDRANLQSPEFTNTGDDLSKTLQLFQERLNETECGSRNASLSVRRIRVVEN